MPPPQDSDERPDEALADDAFVAEVLERLARRQGSFGRYRLKGEIARGGMGVVYRVWDEELQRHLAMKVVLGKGAPVERGDTPPTDSRALARFLEEAQVTGQLDHPGIVPLHELGLDESGHVYFTMRLVKGRDLDAIFALVDAGREGWTVTRALALVLRVSETMAYAHAKKVVHRDLKPSNILVGRYGETYVIDWGLARVLGRADSKDIRLRGEPLSISVVHLGLKDESGMGPDSPLVTMDGDVIGTPAYMAPEQARGELERVGTQADIYSLGAILYQLLTGEAPYSSDVKASPHAIWHWVLSGPPRPIHEVAPHHPPELIAIVEKAMARESPERYADMRQMAEDLRAYLEQRVVQAYRTGPIAELKKWVARNNGTAGALAALVLVIVVGSLALAWRERVRITGVRRTADLSVTAELLEDARDLGPIHPDHNEQRADWLERTRALMERGERYRSELERIRAAAAPLADDGLATDRQTHPEYHAWSTLDTRLRERLEEAIPKKKERLRSGAGTPAELQRASRDLEILEEDVPRLRAEVQRLEAEIGQRRTFRLEDAQEQRLHDRLAEIDAGLERLARILPRVEEDLDRALGLEQEATRAFAHEWEVARAAIASSPRYGNLDLAPQIGLVALDEDPRSGLWEFWHVLSGQRPVRGADGQLLIERETGIVLVLVPGGEFSMGSGPDDPGGHDAERPVQRILLEPYFISKYELTQGQWWRATQDNPSFRAAGTDWQGYGTVAWTHPVESVAWEECRRVVRRYGLELPTEARWERAARAGGSSAYWGGDDFASIEDHVNFQDFSWVGHPITGGSDPEHDDGHPFHAPVGTFGPNPFGLHDVTGNVWEWCREWFGYSYEGLTAAAGTGELSSDYHRERVVRGGSFKSRPAFLRVAKRVPLRPETSTEEIGVRPARSLDR